MKQRVFVTGASGVIGRTVTTTLIESNHEVIGLARLPWAPTDAIPGFKKVVGNILDTESLRSYIAESDIVCHLAAVVPPRFDDPTYAKECLEVNSLATLRLASITCDLGKRFIYSSSGSIYAQSPEPATESSLVYPAARAPYYLGSKLLGELYVEHLRLTRGLRSIIFRVGSVYGRNVVNSVVNKFVSNATAGEPLTVMHGGLACADFVYVEDLGKLILAAVESDKVGIFNAGSGVATSIALLAKTVLEVFAEFSPIVKWAGSEGTPPPGFAALAMDLTNRTFGHIPSSLQSGLLHMKRNYAASPDQARN